VEEAELGVDARVVGRLLHEAARSIYEPFIGGEAVPWDDDAVIAAEARALAAVDVAMEKEASRAGRTARRIMVGRAKQLARRLVLMEATAGSPLGPVALEMEVGEIGGIDVGGVRIRGRIDRVDTSPITGARFVIDYKTGSLPTARQIDGTRDIQLALYLLALAAGGESVMGGVYVSPKQRERSGVVVQAEADALGSLPAGCRAVGPEEVETIYKNARVSAAEAADGMRRGIITPSTDQCPIWCHLGSVCRAAGRG
jgi:RecB family exonuclease